MPTFKARNVCVTISNLHELPPGVNTDKVKYYIFGRETGENGLKHLQGYIEFTKQVTLNQIKSFFNCPTMHVEKRRGTQREAIDYCKKEDQNPIEFGTAKSNGRPQIQIHVDENEQLKGLNELIDEGKSDLEIMNEFPIYSHRYNGFIEKRRQLIAEAKQQAELEEWADAIVLNRYQQDWNERLSRQNDRQITWINDEDGNKGKSLFSKWKMVKDDCIRFTNAKSADIAYAYNGQQEVIINLSRTVDGRVNYGIIEDLKNGMVFSGKYASKSKIYAKGPRIIVMANFAPDFNAMSADRWDYIHYPSAETRGIQLNADGFIYEEDEDYEPPRKRVCRR